MSDEVEKESRPDGGRVSGPGLWLRLVVAGLAAAAVPAAAATDGGHAADVTARGPAVCVVLKAIP